MYRRHCEAESLLKSLASFLGFGDKHADYQLLRTDEPNLLSDNGAKPTSLELSLVTTSQLSWVLGSFLSLDPDSGSFHELTGIPTKAAAMLLDPRDCLVVVADKDGGELVVDHLPLDVVVVGAFIKTESFRDLGQDPIGKDPLGLVVLSNEGFEHWV